MYTLWDGTIINSNTKSESKRKLKMNKSKQKRSSVSDSDEGRSYCQATLNLYFLLIIECVCFYNYKKLIFIRITVINE